MDDEVKIPVKFQVDTSDLSKLKSEVDKIIESANKASKKRGKDALSIGDKDTIRENIANLSILEGEIAKLQQKISELSKTNLGTDFSEAIKDVQYYQRIVDKAMKDRATAQGKLGSATRNYNLAQENEEKVARQIAEIQAKAKADNRELTAQEEQKIALLKAEAELRSRMATEQLIRTRSTYNQSNQTIADNQELLSAAEKRKAELSDILDSEQKSEEYNNNIKNRVEELNKTLEKTAGLYNWIAQSTEKVAEGTANATDKASKESEAQAIKDTKAHIAELKRERSAIQRSTSQFYYKLRAVKMLGFQIKALDSALSKFGKTALNASKTALSGFLKLANPVALIAGSLKKATAAMKKFNQATKRAKKSHDGLGTSLKGAVMTLLKYTLGIRSIYVLFNKLRNAMVAGMENLAQAFDPVNQKMSSIVTSLLQMKNAVAAAVEPMLSVLAPALEKIAALVADVAYKVASFIAALTGRSYVYKATRAQVDYAKSLESTASAAKDVNKQLMAFDELNVINTDKDSGDGMPDPSAMFEEVPIDAAMAEWAKKFKEFLDRLLAPIKKAWEKMKDFVIKSWKYALNEMKLLADAVMEDFWTVWEEYATQKIFENIFKIVGDIGLIVGNIAHNLRIAWKENKNGYRILASIRDIILVITNHLVDLFDYMVDWSTELSFIPLFNALADVLEEQVVPAVDKLMDLFVVLFEDIVLESLRYLIEELIPKLLRAFGNIVEAIGNIAENFKDAWEEAGKGQAIIEKLEEIISYIADAIYDCSEATKDWAAELDFNPLLTAIKDNLDKIEKPIKAITDGFKYFYENVLLPFWKYIVEQGLPKLLNKLGEISDKVDWDALTEKVKAFLDAFEPFLEKVWDTLVIILGDLGDAIADFVNSEEFDKIVDKLIEWMENADPEEMATGVEHLVEAFIGFKAFTGFAGAVTTVLTGIMTFWNLIKQATMTTKINQLTKAIEGLQAAMAGGTGGSAAAGAASGAAGAAAQAAAGIGNLSTVAGRFANGAAWTAFIGAIIKHEAETVKSANALKDYDKNLVEHGDELDALTEKYQSGEITLDEYVSQYEALAGVDLSDLKAGVNGVKDAESELAANQFLEKHKDEVDKLHQSWADGEITLDEFKTKLVELVSTDLSDDSKVSGESIAQGILNGMDNISLTEGVKIFFDNIKTSIKNIFGIGSPAKNMYDDGENIALGILEGFKLVDFAGIIKEFMETTIKPIFSLENWSNIAQGIYDGISAKWNEFAEWWQNTALFNWWETNVAPWFTLEKWQEVTTGIKDGISATWDETVGYWIEALTAWWDENVAPWFTTEKWTEMLTNVVNAFTSTFDSIVTTVTGKIDSIITAAQNMADKISSIVGGILSKIGEIGSTIGNAVSSAGSWISGKVSALNINIPHLAQGAVIPPNKEFMAVLGDQKKGTNIETPLSTMIEAFNAARGDEEMLLREQNEILMAILEKEFSISSKDVFNAARAENNNFIKRTGKSAFVY